MRAPGGTWLGYPKGIFLVAFTELWERFSYYGITGLLVLYLTRDVVEGGLAWSPQDALRFYGLYSGLLFCAPVLGGWLANNYFGERRCILLGGIGIMLGHVLLGLLQSTAGFMAGLACILAGTAFIKPAISSIVAQFYEQGDARKDRAFAMFWLCLYAGALLGFIVPGLIGEHVGWHAGFATAGVGMGLGLTAYLWKQHEYLADLGQLPAKRTTSATTWRLQPEERDRLLVLLCQSLFVVIYALAFYQKGGLLNLYARDRIDRVVLGFEIPATWLLSVSTFSFLCAVPLLNRVWIHFEKRGAYVRAAHKLVIGLLTIAAGYVLLLGSLATLDGQKSSLWWVVGLYVCFGFADALVWPVQMSLASKLAPPRLVTVIIGSWYVLIGIGTWLTAVVAPLAFTLSFAHVFIVLVVLCVSAAAVLFLLCPMLERLTHGAEDGRARPIAH